MHFNMVTLMILGALAASLLLLFRSGERIPAIIAVVAAGVETLIALHLVSFHGPPYLGTVLAAALTIAGAWAWSRVGSKPAVTAATLVAFIGLVQLLVALRLLA
ncbi:MAG TPA: hypothetical protein VK698_28785 [Kofleriaceae bacterium]|nr:hypothetical protein [Kofleriaceae bacterium]